MKEFLAANGVKQITSSPYHSSSKGLAERAVLKKMDGASLDVKLQHFLLNYRITPKSTTGIPPLQFLMGRQLRTCLDQIIPDFAKHVQDEKYYHDKHTRYCNFAPGNHVLVRNYTGSSRWLPGIVETVLGPVSYQVKLNNGRLWKRHLDQPLIDQSHQTDNSQVDEDVIDFALSEPTATVEIPPARHSTRVRGPPDKLLSSFYFLAFFSRGVCADDLMQEDVHAPFPISAL